MSVSDLPDGPAEDIAALVDLFCYVSHLSAMQRYGLTERTPEALTLSSPAAAEWKQSRDARMLADHGGEKPLPGEYRASLVRLGWPETLRGRRLSVHSTKRTPEVREIRDSHARIAAVGETFVQMLDRPELCGGMAHVLDVWDARAGAYLREIIPAVDRSPEKIIKVRAGYILEERLGVRDATVAGWLRFAQRGGSRLLDPSKPYVGASIPRSG